VLLRRGGVSLATLRPAQAIGRADLLGFSMCPPFTPPLSLRNFVLPAFWLGVKIAVGLVIGAALFETVGLVVVRLINPAAGG
jgi:hypothetical protein